MAHNKTIQFYRNNTVVRPDTENNKNALSVAKELLDTSGSKQDGEMTLIRYKEDDEDPVKTLVGVYHKNGNTGTWSYLTEDHPYIPFGICDKTSTSTEFTATVPGIDKLEDGVCCIVKNGVVTSASGFTLNINGLGAKPSYSNMATGNDVTPTDPTRDTTIFNINYAMLFIYSSTIVEGGGWICYRGYDANTNIEPVTYSTLVNTKNGSELKPGQYYRITDYNCTTTQTDTKSAGHQFDILVQATSPNTLSEEAKAIRHEGDTYFADANLEDWKIWYCLDNDTTRFAWADATNGKGVIYRMIDEWNNDCPYDFKNIQFKRKLVNNNGYYKYDPDNGTDTWVYTFAANEYDIQEDEWSALLDGSLESPHKHLTDELGGTYHSNIIKPYISVYNDDEDNNLAGLQYLNDNVFIGYYKVNGNAGDYQYPYCSFNNTFGNDCYSNTFWDNCSYNTFGDYCHSNIFWHGFSYNTLGNICFNNTFGDDCNYNTFGDYHHSNTFGDTFSYNTFGNSCTSNTFGDNCFNNTFWNGCSYNTLGNNCSSNTFGNSCRYNTLGNSCNSITFGNNCTNNTFSKPYTQNVIVENGNKKITLTSTQTSTGANPLRNITIAQGINNTNTVKTISHNTLNDTFRTTYTTDVNGNIYAIAPAKYAEWDAAEAFIVNITDSNGTYISDKTYSQIVNAYNSKRTVIAVYYSEVFQLFLIDDYGIKFVDLSQMNTEDRMNVIYINASNSVSYDEIYYQRDLVSGTDIKTINNQSLLGSGNLTASDIGALPSSTHIPNDIKVGSVAGKLYRNDVNGGGNFTVRGNSGCIPNLTAGTFLVAIYAKSSTQSYTFRFNFGSVSYDLNTTNGEINDVRQITIPSDGTFSGSVLNGSVASGTILYVVMYNYLTPVSTVGVAAVTNRYSDLDGKPTINDFGAAEAIYLTGELNGAYWTFTDIDGNTLTDAEMIALLNDPNKLISIYYDGFTGTEFPGRGHEATVTRNIGSTNWYFEYIDVERLMYFWLALDEYNGKIHDDEHLVRKLVQQASLGQGYSTCTTAASDTAKYCDFDYYKLTSGGIVSVKFVYDVPANSTLNVGDTGAHAIYNRGAAIESGVIKGGDTATFMYDGTYYQLISVDSWQDKYTKAEIDDTEEVIAQALSELDERVTANTEAVESIDALTDGLDEWKEEIEDAIESGERVTAMALTDIDERLENEVSAREQLAQELIDDEQAIAGAMALMNKKLEEVSQSVDDNEQIIAGALVDLDQRITDTNQVIEENELITARALNELANGIPTEAEDINAVPMTRTVNGFNLSEDITVGKPTIYLDCQRDGTGPRNKLVVFGADELIEAGHVPILLRWSRKRFSKGWHHFRTRPNTSTTNVVTIAKETLSIVYGNSSKTYYRTANVVKLNGGEVIDNAGITTTDGMGHIYVNHGKRKFYIKDSNGYHNTKTKWGLAFIDPSDIPTNAAQRLDISRLSTKIAPFYMYYSWTQTHQLVKAML